MQKLCYHARVIFLIKFVFYVEERLSLIVAKLVAVLFSMQIPKFVILKKNKKRPSSHRYKNLMKKEGKRKRKMFW